MAGQGFSNIGAEAEKGFGFSICACGVCMAYAWRTLCTSNAVSP